MLHPYPSPAHSRTYEVCSLLPKNIQLPPVLLLQNYIAPDHTRFLHTSYMQNAQLGRESAATTEPSRRGPIYTAVSTLSCMYVDYTHPLNPSSTHPELSYTYMRASLLKTSNIIPPQTVVSISLLRCTYAYRRQIMGLRETPSRSGVMCISNSQNRPAWYQTDRIFPKQIRKKPWVLLSRAYQQLCPHSHNAPEHNKRSNI